MTKTEKIPLPTKKSTPTDYTDLLRGLAAAGLAAARLLDSHTTSRTPESPAGLRDGLSSLAQSADERLHVIRTQLLRDVVTTLDRGDVFALALAVTAILESLRSVADALYIYTATRPLPFEPELTGSIGRIAQELLRAYGALGGMGKNNAAIEAADAVLLLCDETSQRLIAQRRACVYSKQDPLRLTLHAELSEKYDRCLAAFRDAANAVPAAVMKDL